MHNVKRPDELSSHVLGYISRSEWTRKTFDLKSSRMLMRSINIIQVLNS